MSGMLYIRSRRVVEFCAAHPIDWRSAQDANGAGNKLTPSPAMGLFFDLLNVTHDLFTQGDYADYARERWNGWFEDLNRAEQNGIIARLYRNFYPSAIDSLHVWALLVETGLFSRCLIDSTLDATCKTDITVFSVNGQAFRLALLIDSDLNREWTGYKRSFRGHPAGVIDIPLTMDRPREPGNKRWYTHVDLQRVYNQLANLNKSAKPGIAA